MRVYALVSIIILVAIGGLTELTSSVEAVDHDLAYNVRGADCGVEEMTSHGDYCEGVCMSATKIEGSGTCDLLIVEDVSCGTGCNPNNLSCQGFGGTCDES